LYKKQTSDLLSLCRHQPFQKFACLLSLHLFHYCEQTLWMFKAYGASLKG
jgi:hypothetical protein